jgi:hypothetical protein
MLPWFFDGMCRSLNSRQGANCNCWDNRGKQGTLVLQACRHKVSADTTRDLFRLFTFGGADQTAWKGIETKWYCNGYRDAKVFGSVFGFPSSSPKVSRNPLQFAEITY